MSKFLHDAFVADGRGIVLLTCFLYILGLIADFGGNIAEPIYWHLQAQIGDFRRRLDVSPDYTRDADSVRLRERLLEDAGALASHLSDRRRGRLTEVFGWSLRLNATVLEDGYERMRHLEREAIPLLTSSAVRARLDVNQAELGKAAGMDGQLLRDLISRPQDADHLRMVLKQIQRRLDRSESRAMQSEFDSLRIAQWLTTVGLCAIVLASYALGHQLVLLMGALGGFLAPTIPALTGTRRASRGLLALSPVGGALTAVGGLLLVEMLSDDRINILGSVFHKNAWALPSPPLALALALLFGFSGLLFSRLALSAAGQLSPAGTGSREDSP